MSTSSMLLNDVLHQTLSEPTCALSWHRLYKVWCESQQVIDRQRVAQKLVESILPDSRAEYLRLTFLSDVTADRGFAELAAAHILSVLPINPDRLASFMAFSWGYAVKNSMSREDFISALMRAQLPKMTELLGSIASDCLPDNLVRRVPTTVERVAIIAPYLGNELHTPSTMVANQCEVLTREGKVVSVFSCQELQPPDMRLFNGTTNQVLLGPFDIEYWKTVLPVGAQCTYSDSRFSLVARWREMLALIATFDPDVILFCGFYSPLAVALHKRRPVVGLNVHAFPPLSPIDVWLASDTRSTIELNGIWGGENIPAKNHHHPYRIKSFDNTSCLSRAELSIREDTIVLLTVGGRLANEINGQFSLLMCELLQECTNVIWLLVGGNGDVPKALHAVAGDRIKVLPTRQDISAFLALSDIYVNPPRIGGGYSVAEAMSVGLPVVTFADSDGGDKVGESAFNDVGDYIDFLKLLIENPVLRKDRGQSMRIRFEQHLDLAASGPSLMIAFEKAIQVAVCRFV